MGGCQDLFPHRRHDGPAGELQTEMTISLNRGERLFTFGFLALAAVLGLVAGVDPRLAIAGALACGFVLIVFVDLALGVALFGFLSFLELLGLGSVVSVGKAAGLLLALSWLALIATQPDRKRDFVAEHPYVSTVLALFIGWAAFSVLWATSAGATAGAIGRYGLNVLLFLIVFTAIRTKREATLVLCGIILGGATAALYGIATQDNSVEFAGRLNVTGLDPNELGSLLVAGLALSIGVAANLKGHFEARAAILGAGFLCLLGLFFTVSRGALLALSIALLAGIVFGGRWRLRIMAVSGLIALATVYYFAALAPEQARDRITSSTQGEARVEEGRTTIWDVGWRMVEANFVKGVGAGNFRENAPRYLIAPGSVTRSDQILLETPQVAHNTYLEVLAELGIIGLTMFGFLLVFCVAAAIKAARTFRARGDPGGDAMARALAVAMIGTLAADFFISQEFNKQLWLLLACGPTLLSVAKRMPEA